VSSDGLTVGDGTGAESIRIDKGASSAASLDFYSGGVASGKIEYNTFERLVTNSVGPTILQTGLKDRLNIASNGDISFYEDTGTTAKLFWDASADSLGINKTGPLSTAKLEVKGSGNTNATNSIFVEDSGSAGVFTVRDNGEVFIKDSLGIGTSSPSQKVEISNNANSSTWLKILNTDTGGGAASGVLFENNSGEGGAISLRSSAAGGDLLLRTLSTNPLTFATNSTERMRIDSSGNVGIGTSSPSFALDLQNNAGTNATWGRDIANLVDGETNDTGLRIASSVGTDGLTNLIAATNSSASQFGFMTFNGSAWGERMRIDSSGNVGILNSVASTITTANSRNGLVVGSGSGNNGVTIYSGNTSNSSIMFADATSGSGTYIGQINYDHNADAMLFSTTAAERMRIDSSGRVGIGTTSPLSLLDVTLEATGQRRFLVNYDDSAITIKGSNASSNPESLRAVASTFKVNTGTSGSGTERMRITSSGNVGINEPSPDDKVTINVGSSDNVRAIHLVGGPDITNKYVSIGRTHTVSNDYIDSEIRFGAEVGGSGSSFLAFATGSNNSTERMRIDNSGRVTTPYQPSVRLNLAGHIGINNSAPSYPGVQVNNFTVKENVGSHWNNTNNTFTCPVTGVYCISVFYIKYPASGAAHVDIHKNGSASSIDVRWRASEGDSSYEQAAGTVFVSCAANDILDWHYFGAPGLHSGNGQWSIRLVG
jgi:hypothetical protein